jgi:hypothetical protein
MKVKFIHGPNTGQEAHLANHIAEGLIAAGLAEQIVSESKPIPAPIPAPEWAVEFFEANQSSNSSYAPNKLVCITMRIGRGFIHYFGHPQLVNAIHSWDGGQRYLSGFGRECPEEIRALYERNWNDHPECRAVGSRIAEGIFQSRQQDRFLNAVHKAMNPKHEPMGSGRYFPTNEEQKSVKA